MSSLEECKALRRAVEYNFPSLDVSFYGRDDLSSRMFPPQYIFLGRLNGSPLLLFRQNSSRDLIQRDFPDVIIAQSWLADRPAEIMHDLQEAVPSKSIWHRHLDDLLNDENEARDRLIDDYGRELIDGIDTVAISTLCALSCGEIRLSLSPDTTTSVWDELAAFIVLECASQLVRQASFGKRQGASTAKIYAGMIDTFLRDKGQDLGDEIIDVVRARVRAAHFKARALIDGRDYR